MPKGHQYQSEASTKRINKYNEPQMSPFSNELLLSKVEESQQSAQKKVTQNYKRARPKGNLDNPLDLQLGILALENYGRSKSVIGGNLVDKGMYWVRRGNQSNLQKAKKPNSIIGPGEDENQGRIKQEQRKLKLLSDIEQCENDVFDSMMRGEQRLRSQIEGSMINPNGLRAIQPSSIQPVNEPVTLQTGESEIADLDIQDFIYIYLDFQKMEIGADLETLGINERNQAVRISGILKNSEQQRGQLEPQTEEALRSVTDMHNSVRRRSVYDSTKALSIKEDDRQTQKTEEKQSTAANGDSSHQEFDHTLLLDQDFGDESKTGFPDIRRGISIKEALFKDLEADGLIQRTVPFSNMQKNKAISQIARRASEGEIASMLKGSLAITKNDPSVKKLPELHLSPSMTSVNTMAHRSGMPQSSRNNLNLPGGSQYYSPTRHGITKKASSITINRNKLLMRNAEQSEQALQQQETFDMHWKENVKAGAEPSQLTMSKRRSSMGMLGITSGSNLVGDVSSHTFSKRHNSVLGRCALKATGIGGPPIVPKALVEKLKQNNSPTREFIEPGMKQKSPPNWNYIQKLVRGEGGGVTIGKDGPNEVEIDHRDRLKRYIVLKHQNSEFKGLTKQFHNVQPIINQMDQTEVNQACGKSFVEVVKDRKHFLAQQQEKQVSQGEGKQDKADEVLGLKDFDQFAKDQFGVVIDPDYKLLPSQQDQVQGRFNTLVQPLREKSTKFFQEQNNYLMQLTNATGDIWQAQYANGSTANNTGMVIGDRNQSESEHQIPADFQNHIENFNLFAAFSELKNIDDIDAFQKMFKQMEQMSPDDMRKMKNNPFFKNFTHQYNKNTNESLQKHFGENFTRKSKALQGQHFDQKILNHIYRKNGVRNKLPELFTHVNTEKYKQLEEKLSTLKPVGLNSEILQMKKAIDLKKANKTPKVINMNDINAPTIRVQKKIFTERQMAPQLSPPTCFAKDTGFGYNINAKSPEENIDLMQDPEYLRRIKGANYGEWYLKPELFLRKNDQLDRALNRHNND